MPPTAHQYGPHPLQTLHLYPPPPDPKIHLLFIHGGAWRDPRVTPSIAQPLFRTLSHPLSTVAAFASIGYRLSPHPYFSPANTARHPDHLNDVLAAIEWLREHCGMRRYALIGHSAGATLAFQTAAAAEGMRADMAVGVEGIYALRSLVEEGGAAYREFVEAAFGEEGGGAAWDAASPAVVGVGEWKGLAVLAHSDQDELVGWRQVEEMKNCLEEGGVSVRVVKVSGGHDEVLEEGAVRRVAVVVERYVRELGF